MTSDVPPLVALFEGQPGISVQKKRAGFTLPAGGPNF